MKRIKFYSIRWKLLAVYVTLLLLTSLILFSFFVYRLDKVYKEQADSHLGDVTAMSTGNLSSKIEQIDQLSVSILIDQTVQENLREINKKRKLYDEAVAENMTAERSITAGGSISTNEAAISRQVRGSVFNIKGIISLRIYPLEGEEIFVGTTNREYLEYSMTREEIYEANGAALWGMAGGEHYICLGRAILSTDNMQPLGYMVLICKNEYLSDQLKTVSNAASGKIYLLDEKNRVTASSEEGMTGSMFPYELEKLRLQSENRIQDMATGESSYYYVGNRMENGWTLVTTVSTKQLFNGIFMSILQTTAVLLAALLFSVTITVVVVKKLFAPTQKLLQSMSAFGEGKMESRVDVESRDEIGQIGRAYNHMADNIQNLMEKVYTLELSKKEAEIEFLKMQINPHFLYNTLDTISWLGYTSGNEDITDISVSLAKLLRASIKRRDMVMVSEEMRTIDSYLLIQQYRFHDKLQVERKVQEEACECYMPGFLLQPLVENSIIHGLEKKVDKGRLRIEIKRTKEYLYFTVSDDGKGIDPEKLAEIKKQFADTGIGNGIGLANVYRRLQLLYGELCQFEIDSEPGEGTRISFRIPIILEEEENENES